MPEVEEELTTEGVADLVRVSTTTILGLVSWVIPPRREVGLAWRSRHSDLVAYIRGDSRQGVAAS